MNKKNFMAAVVLLGVCISANAQKTVTTQTYYGTKASNGTNPCKGPTRSICATITTTTTPLSAVSTSIEICTRDPENRVVHTDIYIDPRPMEVVLKELQEQERNANSGGNCTDAGESEGEPLTDNQD